MVLYWQYDELWYLYSKSMLTLLAYLANCPQYIPEDGAIKRQDGPFPGFAQAFSALVVPEQAPAETRLHVLPIMQLCRRHISDPPTLN